MKLVSPLALLAIFVTPAAAQQSVPAQPVPSAVRHAGTLHLASGTWTRHSQATASLGPDTIYRNDVSSGYFATLGMSGASGDWSVIDEGRIPGIDSAGNPSTPGADRSDYRVSGLEFAYCSDIQGPNVAVTFRLYDSYNPCDLIVTSPSAPFHLAGSVSATGLPGSMSSAAQCWTVTLDFSGGGEFCMEADGGPANPGFQFDNTLDSFGIEWEFNGAFGTNTGPMLRGDPDWTVTASGAIFDGGGGTYYEPVDTCGSTGLDTRDFMALDGAFSPLATGCRFFGGYKNTNGCGGPSNRPQASFHTVLFADEEDCDPVSGFCDPNPNSTGQPVLLSAAASGSAGAGWQLDASGGPLGQFGLFVVSANTGLPSVVGQGSLCLEGPLGRYGPQAGGARNSLGSFDLAGDFVNLSGTGGPAGLGFELPLELPNPPGGSIQAGSTWHFQLWYRDQNPAATTNFSDGLQILF